VLVAAIVVVIAVMAFMIAVMVEANRFMRSPIAGRFPGTEAQEGLGRRLTGAGRGRLCIVSARVGADPFIALSNADRPSAMDDAFAQEIVGNPQGNGRRDS
jgi:hypothetical protein